MIKLPAVLLVAINLIVDQAVQIIVQTTVLNNVIKFRSKLFRWSEWEIKYLKWLLISPRLLNPRGRTWPRAPRSAKKNNLINTVVLESTESHNYFIVIFIITATADVKITATADLKIATPLVLHTTAGFVVPVTWIEDRHTTAGFKCSSVYFCPQINQAWNGNTGTTPQVFSFCIGVDLLRPKFSLVLRFP